MPKAFVRSVCRVLVVCTIWLPLQLHAGLIATDQALAGAQARATVAGFVARAEVARQLEAFGVSARAAEQRVAALTDAEALELAGRIETLPAGATAGQFLGFLIIFIFLLWRFVFSVEEKPAAKK